MKFFTSVFAFLFFALPVQAQTLKEIADNYNEELIHGLVDAIPQQKYDNLVQSFRDLHQQLLDIESTDGTQTLWMDLRNYTEDRLGVEASCKPYYWRPEALWAMTWSFDFSDLLQSETSADDFMLKITERYALIRQGIEALEERVIKGMALGIDYTMPSISPYFSFDNRVQEQFQYSQSALEDPSCSFCASVDRDKLINIFRQSGVVGAAEKLHTLASTIQTVSLDAVLVVPGNLQKDCYKAVLKGIYSDLTPDMVLRKGEQELLRSETQMLEQALLLGYQLLPPQSLPVFIEEVFTKLSADPKYILSSEADYLRLYDEYFKRAENKLHLVTQQKNIYPLVHEIELIDDYSFKGGGYGFDKIRLVGTMRTAAGKQDGYRSFELPVFFFHEAIPGHHTEQSINFYINGEADTAFERLKFFSSFTEGWGFYVEELALEIGLYETPEEKLGYLDFLRMRSLRMVLSYRYYMDDWNNDQALQFADEHLFDDVAQAQGVISRPREWTGQGVGYMVGKTIIMALRDASQESLGVCFSQPEFNDSLLNRGATHLDTVVSQTALWLKSHKCMASETKSAGDLELILREKIKAEFLK